MGDLDGGCITHQNSLRDRPPRAISFLAGTQYRWAEQTLIADLSGTFLAGHLPELLVPPPKMSRGDPIHHFHVGHDPRKDPDDAPEREMGT